MLWFVRIDFIHVLRPWYGMIPAQIEPIGKRAALVRYPSENSGEAT